LINLYDEDMRLGAAVLMPFALLPVLAGCIHSSGGDGSLLPTPPTSSSPLPPPPALNAPEPTTPPTTPPPTVAPPPTGSPSPTGFSEAYVVPCDGRPSAAQIIAVVRRHGSFLTPGAKVTATTGPLCSGVWQYTVLAVPDHEPLQVVTKGSPSALTFVTAGTNVCTVDVRAGAPVVLLTTANC
jgi:hypothetical protein